MRLIAQIERARGLVEQYEENQEFYRRRSGRRYELGRLESRLEASYDGRSTIQALRDLLRTDHEAWIAEGPAMADDAAAPATRYASAGTWNTSHDQAHALPSGSRTPLPQRHGRGNGLPAF